MSSKQSLSSIKPTRTADRKSNRNSEVKPSDLLIVGIGASAGGLQAFTQFLRPLPRDSGMALVLVQHLAPKHASALTELLSRTTDIPVAEATDGMAVEPNHVYVIPPDRDMAVHGGKLHLVPRVKAQPHMPIDYFFRSLADDQGSKAIGVIFSGTASDGTLGLKAIKAAGGITFAQDPESAVHADMPRNAIAAGCVDFVLSIKQIANELLTISRHPYLRETHTEEAKELAEGGESELRKIYSVLRVTTGVDFSAYKPTTLRRRIKRRMMLLKLDTLKHYNSYLKDHRNEIDALFQDMLIHVTGFFRDPAVFEGLKTTVFPSLVKDRPLGTPIRVWVVGCSTGEEVYSLAMVLLEFLSDSHVAHEVQIFATDVNDAALDKARMGAYLENIASEVSPERLRRFFIKVPHGYRINKAVREICVFARHDISKDPPFSHLDIISCRNLLIYLGSDLQKRILPIFHYALNPTGYLLLGGSETIGSFADYFSLTDRKHKIYAKKAAHQPLPVNFASPPFPHAGLPGAAANEEKNISFDIQKEADRIVLNRYTPAGVVINDDFQILQFRGRTGRYLEPAPGQATLNLGKMAREGLVVDLRAAIQEARRHNHLVKRPGVQIKRDGRTAEVNIEVVPIKGPMPTVRYFLVLFQDVPPATEREPRKGASALPSRAASREIGKLKEELAHNKSTLQSIIEEQEATNEELRSANEEILSSNEELQSTNEELETAKEELQSANEELTTLNEELQNRNQELSVANNDLLNLLGNVNIAVLMLGNDLCIRRFTPGAQKLLNLIPGDTGRPIGDIKMNFELSGFEKLIADSIDGIAVKELEIQNREGHWFSMKIRPYKTTENMIEGAVITWVEITKIKEALDESVQRYQIFFERNLAGVFNLRKGRIVNCNDAFAHILGYSSREEVLKMENWDIHLSPQDRRSIYKRLMEERSLDNCEVCLRRLDGTPVWVLASVDLIARGGTDSKQEEEVEGIIFDINRRVQAERQLVNLSNYLMKSSDDRRRSLSRELHDQVGSRLAGLSASLAALESTRGVEAEIRKGLAECRTLVRECADEIRTVSFVQHPLIIDDLGLAAAVRSYAQEFSKRAGVNVKTDIADSVGRLPAEIEIALYRIIQECLTNIQLHSGSPTARIRINETPKYLMAEVQDFGKGFKTDQEGVGLTGMRERMKEVGGRLEIESGKKGTTVRAVLPLPLRKPALETRDAKPLNAG